MKHMTIRQSSSGQVGFWGVVLALVLALSAPAAQAGDFVIGKIGGPQNTKVLKPKVREGLESVIVELGHNPIPYKEYLKVGKGMGIGAPQAMKPAFLSKISQEMKLSGFLRVRVRFNPKKQQSGLTVVCLDSQGNKLFKDVYDFDGRDEVPQEVLDRFRDAMSGAIAELEAAAAAQAVPEVPEPPVAEEPTSPSQEGQPVAADESAADAEGKKDRKKSFGRLYVGLGGDLAVANVSWRGRLSRAGLMVLGQAQLGVAVTKKTVLFELGAKIGYGLSASDSWPTQLGYEGRVVKWNHLVFGFLPRLMFPVIGRVFYLGGELEAILDKSDELWVGGALRLGASLMIGPYFEIRLLPVGAMMLQELEKTWTMTGYSASATLVFRFL